MKEVIAHVEEQFSLAFSQVASTKDVEEMRVRFLGRKGPIQELMKSLRDVASEERPHVGKLINDLKIHIQERLDGEQERLLMAEEQERLGREKVDVTLPGKRAFSGGKHLITQVMDEILEILIEMGFSVQYAPEIDNDYYNFEALHFPPDHPARDMQDTFYLPHNRLLRTHTTNLQIRMMEKYSPPIRAVCPGKVYRNEEITSRSHVFFHQIDPFYIDRNVTFVDLLSTLDLFLSQLFQREVKIRYRTSYFPFTEPSLEADVSCMNCNQKGCSLCKRTGWLEILGAGMIHPEVLKNGGIDPEVYSGYAWGMGVERIALLRHRIEDIRLFTENDSRFLAMFA